MFNTPFNIAGYTEKLIRDQQAKSISDVAANDPSVRAVNSDSSIFGDNLRIRGFDVSPNDFAFDGLYGILPQRLPSLQNVDRVEILKGPSLLLNGVPPQGAIGGTVNLVPKRATDEPLTRVTPFFLSQGTGGVAIDWARRFGEANEWGIRINGLYRNGNTPVDKERLESGFGSVALDYRGERVRFSFDFSYGSNEGDANRALLTLAPGIPVPRAPRLTRNLSQPWEFSRADNFMGATRLEVDVNDYITVFGAFGAGSYRESALAGFQQIFSPAGYFTGPVYRQTWDSDGFSGEAGVRAKFDTGFLSHNLTISAAGSQTEWRYPKLTQALNAGVSNIYNPVLLARPFYTDVTIDAKGQSFTNRGVTFADTISAFGDRVQLTVGGRFQEIASKNYQTVPGTVDFGRATSRYDKVAWSPAVALVVKPLENLSVYGNYMEGLVSGGTAPIYARNANQALPAVKADQKEIGVKYDFGAFGASLAFFEINRPNAGLDMLSFEYSLNGVQRNRGIELNVFGEPFAGFRLLGGVAFTEGRQVQTANNIYDGKVAPGVPETTFNLYGEYDLPPWLLPGLTATGRVIYTSSQYYDQANTQKLPDWTRLDLGLRYTFTGSWGKPVTLRANVENVLGANYWAAAAAAGSIGLGRPRTYMVSAQFDF